MAGMHNWEIDLERQREIESLRAQLASARKALEPFVEIAKELQPHLASDYKNTMYWAVPTVGQIRAAADAYNGIDSK